jgi:lipopolysaccharide transport system ATP-binding protein
MQKEMIRVENLSKRYRTGRIGTGTLSHDLNAWWRRIRKLEEYETDSARSNEFVWSLKDINFTVAEGEVFGVVGKNGAGKSTLLKTLSRITRPTTGSIKLAGRVASLLEVGTGFHPELTGRENVFLNGAILGMSKAEITRKFDEIVDFSGVNKYIDTPVKRYSSGMYVRLAFAVSAFLEQEILILDEVLSVGDAEFQQKCMGKMKDVADNQGRTILFVSHNMPAIKQLCNRALLLEQGLQKAVGSVSEILEMYQSKPADPLEGKRGSVPARLPAYFTDWRLEGTKRPDLHSCYSRERCRFSFGFQVKDYLPSAEIRMALRYEGEAVIVYVSSRESSGSPISFKPGSYKTSFAFALPVRHGNYQVEVAVLSVNKIIDSWTSGTPLVVVDNFESHVAYALLNPETTFSLEESVIGAPLA